VPSEKELDKALESALRDDKEFRDWFLDQLPNKTDYKELVLCRSDHPWGKIRAILPNENTGALEPIERESETDILAVFENSKGIRVGVHIENKLALGSFTRYQPDLYAARAEQWMGRKAYGAYHHWLTVLLAPKAFIEAYESDCRKFQIRITHEQLAEKIDLFSPSRTNQNIKHHQFTDSFDDPTPNPNYPEFESEVFQMYKELKLQPNDIADKDESKKYQEWLTSISASKKSS